MSERRRGWSVSRRRLRRGLLALFLMPSLNWCRLDYSQYPPEDDFVWASDQKTVWKSEVDVSRAGSAAGGRKLGR